MLGSLFFLLTLLLVSLINHFPILKKNISEDDGNWYYVSIFRKFRIYNGIIKKDQMYKNFGFFNLHAIFQFIYLIFNKEDADFSKKIKYYWYVLTDVAVFVTSYILWGNPLLSFVISLIYIVQICQPETFSDLTYAEFFVVLPFCITMSLFYIGLDLSSVYLIFFAGCMASIVYQIKPIYIFVLIIPFFSNIYILNSFIYFYGGFLFLLLIPFAIILIVSDKRKLNFKYYFDSLLNIYISFYYVLANKYGRKKLKIANGCSDYIQGNWDRFKPEVFRKKILEMFMDIFINLRLLLILIFISLYFIKHDYIFLLVVLTFLNLIMVYIQKAVYQPKFGFIYFPFAFLAGFSTFELFKNSNLLILFFISLVFIYHFKDALFTCFTRLRKENLHKIGIFNQTTQAIFDLCSEVAHYINKNTDPDDFIYVYGNWPSIYLLSKRRAPYPGGFFAFPNNKQNIAYLKNYLDKCLKKNVPVYFFDMNYNCPEAWTAKQVFDYIGVNYNKERNFRITDRNNNILYNSNGMALSFDLYSLDKKYYVLNKIEKNRLSSLSQNDKIKEIERLSSLITEDQNIKTYLEFLVKQDLSLLSDSDIKNILFIESLINFNDLSSAQEELLKLVSENKSNSFIWLFLGEIAFIENRIKDAEAFFKTSYEINPYSVVLLNNISVLEFHNGNVENALKILEDCLRYFPDYSDAIKNRDLILQGLIKNND